jgi:hypothetical protein
MIGSIFTALWFAWMEFQQRRNHEIRNGSGIEDCAEHRGKRTARAKRKSNASSHRAGDWGMRDDKSYMQTAPNDFGGHSVEAIRATDEAVRQLNFALDIASAGIGRT